ncbi:MAG: 4Fe-4S dicluster domain-containing protein [Proteobacteria bacterium]|nr:4Fe-4S dicluster domain-containing protein [Pseudomonadota bacterium]
MSKTSPKQVERKWRVLRFARRISQAVFLIVFLWLIGITASVTGSVFDATSSIRIPYPVEAFLDIDPLAGAIVLLTTGTIPGAMIFGLIVLASGLLLGRAFCSWVCPMGTMNHLVSEIAPGLKGKRRIKANQTRPYQKIKYILLIGVLGAAVFGSAVGGLLDPICLATRGISLTFLPWIQWALGALLDKGMESNAPALQHAADQVYDTVGSVFFFKRGIIVAGGFLISLLFLAVLVMNRFIPRFWCRGLCPLGALLGLLGRFGILTLKNNEDECNKCGKCQLHCSGAASPEPQNSWQRAECDLCMNCVTNCPKNACAFALAGHKTDEQPVPDLKRRTVLAGAAAGAALVPAMRTGVLDSPGGRPDPACIRPPGALDEPDFLDRCIRCGQCMKICPSNAIHPAFDEAGIEGLWTPILVPRIGYCEPTCTLCTQVCPTGAIHSVTEKQKLGRDDIEMIRIGTAFFDRGRCLPWAMGTPCIVCEEFCPTSPKAIWFSKEEVTVQGQIVTLKRPHLDPTRCNGCGACEFVCPVHDKAAIRVSSAGESRAPTHELLLDRSSRNKK